jgi:hypothetical protein
MFIFVAFLGAGKKTGITEGDFIKNFNPKYANILLHYIIPVLSIISFLVFEREIILQNGVWTLLVAVPSCLYWVVYMILSSTKKWEEPYKFTSKKNVVLDVLIGILIPLSFILFSIVLWIIK